MLRCQKIRNWGKAVSKISSEHHLCRALVERTFRGVHVDDHGSSPFFFLDSVSSRLPEAVNEFFHFFDRVLSETVRLMVVRTGENVFDVHPLAPFVELVGDELWSSVRKDFHWDAIQRKVFLEPSDDFLRCR
jgi:hypothetical protein